MNEAAARDVLLLRALESEDADGALLSAADRSHASRAAAELTRWNADDTRAAASAGSFLAQRARLLLDKLGQRQPVVGRAARALAWRPWIDVLLPLVAFVCGMAFERIGAGRSINLLAFPLLVLVAWNLLVYLLVGIGWLRRLAAGPRSGPPTGLRGMLQRLALRALPRGGPLANALARFGAEWLTLSAPLNAARAARVLHLAAALFAAGVLAGLYLRGLVLDYRAVWESTFLDAPTVHRLLQAVLGPAAQWLGQPFPTVDEIALLRSPPATGESAARWIHWYALAIGAVVVLPRLLLALAAGLRTLWFERRFPLDLSAPYFRRLTAGFARGGPTRLRVLPYSYTLDEAQIDALRQIARRLYGDDAELLLRPSLAYGDEAQAAAGLRTDDAQVALTLALFNLAATPEDESHGRMLEALQAAQVGPHALLVDEGPYLHRLGAQAGAEARLQERRAAWQAFAAARGWPLARVDLGAPDFAAVERALAAMQDGA